MNDESQNSNQEQQNSGNESLDNSNSASESLDNEIDNDYDYEYNDGSEQIDPDDYTEGEAEPEKVPSRNEQAYKAQQGNKNYYKDQAQKLKDDKAKALEEKEKAKEETEKAKEKKEEAKEKKKEATGDDKKSAKKDYKEANKELKQSQRKQKEANRAAKEANRRITQNKIKSLQSKAYQVSHPIQATKEHLKQKAKKSIETKIVTLIKKHPFILIFIGLGLFLCLLGIIIFAVLSGGNLGSFGGNNIGMGSRTSCNYGTRGINDQTVVELINCESTTDNYTVLETIPLEKYIAGVAIAEMGEDYVDEAMKAQLVAVRSYTLTRNIPEYSAGYDASKNVIRMRACENDQVYWDYTKDIYRSANAVRDGVSKYSPEYTPAEGETPWKTALSEEEITKYEALVSTVMGEFLVDSNNEIMTTGYTNVETQKFIELANNNAGTENGKYTAILLNVYGSSSINAATCTTSYFGAAGEYSSWKQNATLGSPWAYVTIGDTATIDEVGCLVVSISMQIAHSGVPTGDIVEFNPGTFARALKEKGYFSSGGAINDYTGIEQVIPTFKYAGDKYFSYNDEETIRSQELRHYQTIKSYAEQGYYIVIEVRKHDGGQHWVALDVQNSNNANWQNIYIWDPATSYTSIDDYSKYRVNRIVYFKVESGESV